MRAVTTLSQRPRLPLLLNCRYCSLLCIFLLPSIACLLCFLAYAPPAAGASIDMAATIAMKIIVFPLAISPTVILRTALAGIVSKTADGTRARSVVATECFECFE